MTRPDWMTGCAASLSGLHVYQRVKSAGGTGSSLDEAECHACRSLAPSSVRLDVLGYIEAAEKEIAAINEMHRKMQPGYLRAGNKV